jgi:hypothetical protein
MRSVLCTLSPEAPEHRGESLALQCCCRLGNTCSPARQESAGVPSDEIYIKNKKSVKQNQPKTACSAGLY